MSKKDNQLAAELARALHHLRRMEGRLCWDREGLWLCKGQINTDNEIFSTLYDCIGSARPNFAKLYKALMQPEKRQIDQGRLSQWQFHLRSLPTPKEFAALAATGTPPLRKYRTQDSSQLFNQLKARHRDLQHAFDAWQSFKNAVEHEKPIPLKSQVSLHAMGLCAEPTTVVELLIDAPAKRVESLLQLLGEETPYPASSMALGILAAHRWQPGDNGWPVHVLPHWREWWAQIHQSFHGKIQRRHVYGLWLLMCQTPDTPKPKKLKQLTEVHVHCHQICGPTSQWLALWGDHPFGWKSWRSCVHQYQSLSGSPGHEESDSRFADFLQVLQAIARQDKPSGRFEDIDLHQKLQSLEGTHTERARSMVDLLVAWLEDHPHPLGRPGASRQMARDIAHQLHQDDWYGMVPSLTKRWHSLFQSQQADDAMLLHDRLDEAWHKAKDTVFALWRTYEESKQPDVTRRKKQKHDEHASQPYNDHSYAGQEGDERTAPEPFVPQLSPPLAQLLEPPSPSEVPMDPLGWMEWLWHRAWQQTPGARAMLLQELLKPGHDAEYHGSAQYALWHFEPLLAMERESNATQSTYSLLASQGDFSFLEYTPHKPNLCLINRFDVAIQSCPLSPDHLKTIHSHLKHAINKHTPPGTDTLFPWDPLRLPTAAVYCEPDEIVDFVEDIASWQQLRVTHEYDPVEYWYNDSQKLWWHSVLRTGVTGSIVRLLASKNSYLREWGIDAASRVKAPGSEERLRKMLRKARDGSRAEQEKLALALGRQGQQEDAWKILVLLKKHPDSMALMVATERCGHAEHTQEAYDIWQSPATYQGLIAPAHMALSLETRCPALTTLLMAEIARVTSAAAQEGSYSTPGLSRALWILASKAETADQCQQALQRIAEAFPQWCGHAVREAFTDLQGLHQTLLHMSVRLDQQPDSWDPLLEWLAIRDELMQHDKHIDFPACIDDSIWRFLWISKGRYGLDDVIKIRSRWGDESWIALALRHRLSELSPETRRELARRLFLGANYYTTGGFQLSVEVALSTPDPQVFCDQLLSVDLTREHPWRALWLSVEEPESQMAQFLKHLRNRIHFYESPDSFFFNGIDVLQAWLPPERALPHIRQLLQEFQEAVGREDETDGSLWASLLVPTLLETDDEVGSQYLPGDVKSYRVMAMLVQDYLAEAPDFDKDGWLEALGLSGANGDEEQQTRTTRAQWLLGQIHAYLP